MLELVIVLYHKKNKEHFFEFNGAHAATKNVNLWQMLGISSVVFIQHLFVSCFADRFIATKCYRCLIR